MKRKRRKRDRIAPKNMEVTHTTVSFILEYR